jgi:N-acyl-D-amino-acid deacylase
MLCIQNINAMLSTCFCSRGIGRAGRVFRFSLIALLAAGGPVAAAGETVLLRGGMVVDGTGSPGRVEDVWVQDGRIVRLGGDEVSPDHRIVDVSGLVVAPGFIDTHAHGDPLQTPLFENFLRMGVTTISLGQDGSSPFAEELEEWRQQVEAAGVGVNIAPFIGHGTVRSRSGVGLDPDPSAEDLQRMVALVKQAMEAGAFGLTTGLEYQPGSFAKFEELVELARPVARADGVVMSHLRSEDTGEVLGAIDELIEQGRAAASRVHISHIKVVYGRGAGAAEEVLQKLDEAQRNGMEVTADLYPYIASYTGIGIVFPDWAKPPFDYAEVVQTRRDELAEYLRARIIRRNGPEATLFGSGKWRGKTLAAAAVEAGRSFEEILIDLGPSGASGAYFVMNAETMERFLVDPRVMISSDGSPTMLHPRGYGSFARIIRQYVREAELLALEEAVFKMTGLPAQTLRMDQGLLNETRSLRRGRIEEGWAADLVVFAPEEVMDTATFETPHQMARGFRHVMVNGRFVIEEGNLTGARPGLVLKKAADHPVEVR